MALNNSKYRLNLTFSRRGSLRNAPTGLYLPSIGSGSQSGYPCHGGSKISNYSRDKPLILSNELFEEFSEDVRQKYNVPDTESYMKLNHKERNKMFYEVIKHHKICVIPSNTVESLDKMPRF